MHSHQLQNERDSCSEDTRHVLRYVMDVVAHAGTFQVSDTVDIRIYRVQD